MNFTARIILTAGVLTMIAVSVRAQTDIAPGADVDVTLDALHERGQSLHSFTANLKLTETDTTFGTDTIRRGRVWFNQSPGTGALFRVTFDTRQAGTKRPETERKEYLLDGNVLIDRNYHDKIQVTRQVAQPGEKVDLFQLGKGPFPLPIGQDKASVRREFEVTLIASAPDDPAGTIHLHLLPHAGTDLARKFSTVDVFVDRHSRMPVRIETSDPRATTIRATELSNVIVNPQPGLNRSNFELPKIDSSWNISTETLGK